MSQVVSGSESFDSSKKRSLWPMVMLIIAITSGPAVLALIFSMFK